MVIITRLHSMVPNNSQSLGQFVVAADDYASVAGGAEIFRRIKTETANFRDGAGLANAHVRGAAFRAERLRCLFNHIQVMPFRDQVNWVHFAAQTKQVNWNDRANFATSFINQHSTGISSTVIVDVP